MLAILTSIIGIVAKGRELGITEHDFAHPQEFKAAVLRGAMRAA